MSASSAMTPGTLFTLRLFGLEIPISDSIVMMWIIMAVLIVLAVVFTRNLKTVPKGKQNVAELIVESINKLIESTMGEYGKHFAPYFGTLFLFLVLSNAIDMFSILPTGDQLYALTGISLFKGHSLALVPPTKDLNVTLTFALMTICLIPISAIRYTGLKGWLKSFLRPSPVMLPFHILDYGTRTLSLSLRLFGNILAGFIIMTMILEASVYVKPLLPIATAFFDLFDAALQAYVFVFLSSIYISEAIEGGK